MKCARTACDNQLEQEEEVYSIWNEPSTDTPRKYCQACGSMIIRFNHRDDDMKLRHEITPSDNSRTAPHAATSAE